MALQPICVTSVYFYRLIIIMKPFYVQSLIILYLFTSVLFAEPADRIADLIRQGNIHELSKLFAPNIEISIPGNENMYSKVQAELILDKFFNQNKPKSVKILHKINSNPNYRFVVLIINTDKGLYRISCTLKEIDGTFMMIEMRIETEKVK